MHEPLLDEARLAELGSALGEERLHDLLKLLASECRDRPHRFRCHLARADLAGIRAEAHNFRGAAGSIGAVALAGAASAIEQLTNLTPAPALFVRLDAIADLTARAATHRRAV